MKIDSTKILGSFNNLNDQMRYAILAGVVLLIILLDVFFLALPQISGIDNLNSQMKQMTQDTQEVLTDSKRIDQLKKKLEVQRADVDALSSKVRPIQEVPVILSTISSIANEFGVKIDQLVPEKTQQETLLTVRDDKYLALPIVIKARCGYHMFGHFLNKLESENMCFIMKDFIIQSDDKDVHTHSFSLTIKLILVDRH